MLADLEYHNSAKNSHKFWRISVAHDNVGETDECWSVTAFWGRIGSRGQKKSWAFDTEKQARKNANERIRLQRRQGYDDSFTSQATAAQRELEKEQRGLAATPKAPSHGVIVIMENDEAERATIVVRFCTRGFECHVDGAFRCAPRYFDLPDSACRFVDEYVADLEREGFRISEHDTDGSRDYEELHARVRDKYQMRAALAEAHRAPSEIDFSILDLNEDAAFRLGDS
jgi:predicted DNA-binding WGR domain protein